MRRLLLVTGLLATISGCGAVDGTPMPVDRPTYTSMQSSGFFGEILNTLSNNGKQVPADKLELLDTYKGINPMADALLEIPDFGISYPVLCGVEDNKQYLRHNIYGDYDVYGSIFLDYRCDLNLSSVKLVHGHNSGDDTYFGRLPELLNLESVEDAPPIFLYTEDSVAEYQVISVCSVDSREFFVDTSILDTYEDVENLLRTASSLSVPLPSEWCCADVLVLNTCWYGDTGDQHGLRCLVFACRKV